MKNYYKILNLEKNTSAINIKKSYRELAKKHHPDVNNSENAHTEFLEINEAYKVLNNPIRRIQYDKLSNYRFSNKIPKSPKQTRKHTKWETQVNKTANRGTKKGEKQSSVNDKKFQKKMSKWDKIWDSGFISFFFDFFIDGVLRVILELIFTI